MHCWLRTQLNRIIQRNIEAHFTFNLILKSEKRSTRVTISV